MLVSGDEVTRRWWRTLIVDWSLRGATIVGWRLSFGWGEEKVWLMTEIEEIPLLLLAWACSWLLELLRETGELACVLVLMAKTGESYWIWLPIGATVTGKNRDKATSIKMWRSWSRLKTLMKFTIETWFLVPVWTRLLFLINVSMMATLTLTKNAEKINDLKYKGDGKLVLYMQWTPSWLGQWRGA